MATTTFSPPGLAQYLSIGDTAARKATLKIARELQVREVVLGFSMAELHQNGKWSDAARAYLDTLFDHFTVLSGITVYPRLFFTPVVKCLAYATEFHTTYQPALPTDDSEIYARLCDAMLDQYASVTGKYWQIWNEANGEDHDGRAFALAAKLAMKRIHARSKQVVLGGIIPYEPSPAWACMNRLLECADAVSIHAFPGTWNAPFDHWGPRQGWIDSVRSLGRYFPEDRIWLETGFATDGDPAREEKQIRHFEEFCAASAEKKFWSCAVDTFTDHRAGQLGLVSSATRRPLCEHWSQRLLRGQAVQVENGKGLSEEQKILRSSAVAAC